MIAHRTSAPNAGRARRACLLFFALALATTLAGGRAEPAAAADPAQVPAAQAHLANERGGAAADWQPVYQRTALVPRSREAMWVGKFINRRTGELATVYRDAQGGTGGPELLERRSAEVLAALSAFDSKADEPLRTAVAAATEGGSLPVAIWLDADASRAVAAVVAAHPELKWIADRPIASDLATVRALRAELHEARRGVYAAAQRAFTAQVQAHGGRIAYASTSAPLVFIDIPAARLRALAERPEVQSLGLEGHWRPAMASAGPTVDANWTSSSGDQGSGVRVAVVEYHNVRNSGDLSGQVVASYSASGALAYTGAGQFDHPTWVAGAVASRSATNPGVAPAADIVSSSTGGGGVGLDRDRRVVQATDWAIAPSGGDADIVNTSLVQDTTTGAEETRRYFDSIVWEDGRLAVSASGNYSALRTWNVGSPGTGYNVLTVGGIDDRGTSWRTDDRIWYVPGSDGSSYVDPVGTAWNRHGDFNKPNVSAPAVGVTTANGLAATGTSAATPIVSGIAAQIIANQPTFAGWPEAVRAIIMASAVYHTPMPAGGLSAAHEGVGTVSALWANRILNSGDGTFGGSRFGSMSAPNTVSHAITVTAGQRVRVALAWDSHTSGASNIGKADTLTADLDLQVVQPNGASVGSYSIDNSYEFVEFTAVASGTATITIRPGRFDGSSEVYGLEWTKSGGNQTPPAVTSRYPAAGTTGASPATTVYADFSEPVTGVSSGNFVLRDAATGSVIPATVTYDAAARRATLVTSAPLAAGRSYNVPLSGSIRDVAGNPLPWTTWTFTTAASDTIPPALISRSPAPAATNVSVGTTVQVAFSEAVSGVSSGTFVLRDAATGAVVSATVSYDTATRRATLRPSAALGRGRSYKVGLSGSIRDLAGNSLVWTTWTFTTAP